MKKIVTLFLMLCVSMASCFAKILYENNKLLIETTSSIDPLRTGKGYEHVFYYFTNKTSNTLRVNCKITVRFVHAGAKDITRYETVYLKHNETKSIYPAEYDVDAAHRSAIIPIDFELINYAEKQENKEVAW